MQFDRHGENVIPRIHVPIKTVSTIDRFRRACAATDRGRAERIAEYQRLHEMGEVLFERSTQLRIYRGDE